MSRLTISHEYKCHHLFVLIGKNPLPNYVAAKLLLNPDSNLYIIYTTETKTVAERLAGDILKRTVGKDTELIHVDSTRSSMIYKRVYSAAQGKRDVGLHYTGGTKSMAIHTYRAIVDTTSASDKPPILSYLDASNLSLQIDIGTHESRTIPLATAIKPPLELLLALHGSTIKNREDEAFCPEIYQARIQSEPELANWRAQIMGGPQGQSPIPLPQIERLSKYWDGCITIEDLANLWDTSIGQIKNWFGDFWLEHYTLAAIQAVADECEIHDCAKNIKTVEETFEFDVVAMRGYQLFAISCANRTTPSGLKNTLKQKLFEAYIRARQMGGDEARVGLVCRAPKRGDSTPRKIEAEIAANWDAAGKVKVFGEEHLLNLQQHLRNWFLER